MVKYLVKYMMQYLVKYMVEYLVKYMVLDSYDDHGGYCGYDMVGGTYSKLGGKIYKINATKKHIETVVVKKYVVKLMKEKCGGNTKHIL